MTSSTPSVELAREQLAEAIKSSDYRSEGEQRELLAGLLAEIFDASRAH
jgi:hypothetical protein